MRNPKTTFRQILKNTEAGNSRKLMSRARKANRVAKIVRGRGRKKAYDVKHRALGFLVERMPGRASVHCDLELADFVVVKLKETRRGLHYPAARLARS